MRVLIIGGTNFIGPLVVTALHEIGHEVTLYHRGEHEAALPSAVRHIHSPRAGIPVLHFPSSLSDPPPEVVLHMFPVGDDDARAAAARFAGVARRMVAISSGDVYRAYGRLMGTEPGPPEPVPLAEDAPLRQSLFPYRHMASGPSDWMYHYDKILAEREILNGRVPGTVLRLPRSEEHTSELQSRRDLVCRLLLEKKKITRSQLLLLGGPLINKCLGFHYCNF